MSKIKALAIVVGTTLALLLPGAPAQAQATRTWVSGVGDDANPCSRTAPCKTFAGAISKTATGGYINCLDPGGFGAVTITKAITIQCEEEIGHVLQTGGFNGINVNVASGTNVTLRGLTIEGAGSGGNGISLNTGGNLHLQEVVVTGFTNSGVNIVTTTGVSQVHIVDTYITDSATNASTAGIRLAPTGGGAINAELNRVSVENNPAGILANGTGGIVNAVMRETVVANGSGIGIQGTTTGSAVNVLVDRTTVTAYGTGVNANGAAAAVRIGNSTITNNVTGVSTTAGGNLRTYKNNQINGNLSDGTPIANVDGLN
jgi:hypothetical protein